MTKQTGPHSDQERGNRLSNEKSPYLLQHSSNPVDWYPWCDEAFLKAKKENKPIFLSIGYSTCHWCHVMEHESFEDGDVAYLLNEMFIAIKVDREERPDIDAQYMKICQLMTGRGGWPLTIIMTPTKKPFFAATYIPKESRFGAIGMLELLPRIKDVWQSRHGEVLHSADQIVQILSSTTQEYGKTHLEANIFSEAYSFFNKSFDHEFGGFGQAPKFPSPHNLLFLLRYWQKTGDKTPLDYVKKTLRMMRSGGIFDHIGLGFHRYSTDRNWLVPHFEKMLYDQALLCLTYLETYQATGITLFGNVAEEILTYVRRDMTSNNGGFFSAEDADSERIEGKFYVWSLDEIESLIPKEDQDFVYSLYSIRDDGNYTDESTGQQKGQNILHNKMSNMELQRRFNIDETKLNKKIEAIRKILFAERKKRIHPLKDDKILTDWNGLMIAAFAKAGQILNNPAYIEIAQNAVSFIEKTLVDENEYLLHRFREGDAAIQGYLDDYSFFIWGLLELYNASFSVQYLSQAIQLTEKMIELFWDEKDGGFFMTANNAEILLTRSKELYDGAFPSGNAVAFHNFVRLAHLTGRTEYYKYSDILLHTFSEMINRTPHAYTHFLSACQFALEPVNEIVVVGKAEDDNTVEVLEILRKNYLPQTVVLFIDSELQTSDIHSIAPYTKSMVMRNNKTTIYVCADQSCQLPTNDISQMMELLIKPKN